MIAPQSGDQIAESTRIVAEVVIVAVYIEVHKPCIDRSTFVA